MKRNYLYLIFIMAFAFAPAFSNGQEAETTSDVNDDDAVACTADAKMCPDGSYVGRQGPNCEFAECPGIERDEDNDLWPSEVSDPKLKREQNQGQEKMRMNNEGDEGDEDMDDDSATSTDEKEDKRPFSEKSEIRKSRVSNAVQEMLRVASSTDETIGEQIREIAQEQKMEHEEAEEVLEKVAKRGGFARFFIGPDYSEIKKAEEYVEMYQERLEKMGEEVAQVTGQDLMDSLNAQIQEMQQVKTELEDEIEDQKGGFSLFGWLNRLLSN